MKSLKAKVAEDKVSIQKFGELMVSYYLKGNKEISRIVKKYSDEKHTTKRRYSLDELEAAELLDRIEKDFSPLRDIEEALEEIERDEAENLYF